jgi:hypothetical protein
VGAVRRRWCEGGGGGAVGAGDIYNLYLSLKVNKCVNKQQSKFFYYRTCSVNTV